MAKKSKTQKAKASAARARRKEEREASEEFSSGTGVDKASTQTECVADSDSKPTLLQRNADRKAEKAAEKQRAEELQKRMEKREQKEKAAKKKSRFQFFKDVRSELKRVTWPTKQEVLRWSLVVVAALVFFGVFIAVLDNLVVTNILLAISGLAPGA